MKDNDRFVNTIETIHVGNETLYELFSPSSDHLTTLEATFLYPNEHNTSSTPTKRPSVSPTNAISTVPQIDSSSQLPSYMSTTKPSQKLSLLPSIPPSILTTTPVYATTIEPSTTSQIPSSFPSLSYNHIQSIATSPTETKVLPSKKPTSNKDQPSQSFQNDLVFSSGSAEEDSQDLEEDKEPNAGVGIGMGLLVVTPVVILVIGVLYEIKRRKRRRRAKNTILPLQSANNQEDSYVRSKRPIAVRAQNKQSAGESVTTIVSRKEVKHDTKKLDSEKLMNSSNCKINTKETANPTVAALKSTQIVERRITSPSLPKVAVIPANLNSERISAKRANIREANAAKNVTDPSEHMRINSTISEQSSDSIQSMTSLAIRTVKSVIGTKESTISNERVTAQNSVELAVQNPEAVVEMSETVLRRRIDKEVDKKSNTIGVIRTKSDTSTEFTRAKREVKGAKENDTPTSTDDASLSSSISDKSSDSIQSMTCLAIQTVKSVSEIAKSKIPSTPITRYISDPRQARIVAKASETNNGNSRSKSVVPYPDKNTRAIRERMGLSMKEAFTLFDEESVNSSSSTQSSASVQSMTSLAIRSTKCVSDAIRKKKEVATEESFILADELSISSSDSTQSSASVQSMTSLAVRETKESTSNVGTSTVETIRKDPKSFIVKKNDAATFLEMLNSLPQFFDCNG